MNFRKIAKVLLIMILALFSMCTLASCACKHENSAWQTTIAPTCSEPGEKSRICADCGNVLETASIEKTSHSFEEWEITKDSTCTESGEKVRYCKCGEKQSEVIKIINHTYGQWEIAKQPTCTEPGEKVRFCKCGQSETLSVAATGHKYGEKTISLKPTCDIDGYSTSVCSYCGTEKTTVESKTGHSWIAATCKEPSKCSNCEKTDGEALGHKYDSNGKCTRCGESINLSISLPAIGSSYNQKNTKGITRSTLELMDISYKPEAYHSSNNEVYVRFTVVFKCTYVDLGVSSAYYSVRYRLVDSDGVTIDNSGVKFVINELNESFKGTFLSSALDPNKQYKLELMDVNG